MESLAELSNLIRDLGAPVVVLGWFMWRDGKRMDKMQETLQAILAHLGADVGSDEK